MEKIKQDHFKNLINQKLQKQKHFKFNYKNLGLNLQDTLKNDINIII